MKSGVIMSQMEKIALSKTYNEAAEQDEYSQRPLLVLDRKT